MAPYGRRGCPYGAYFSSNAATLPAAYATGNLTLRPFSIVHQLIYDPDQGRATGVRVIDAETSDVIEFHARVIFCCAAAAVKADSLRHVNRGRMPRPHRAKTAGNSRVAPPAPRAC